MDLKTILRKIELKKQFIQILEEEVDEKRRLEAGLEKGNPTPPAAANQ